MKLEEYETMYRVEMDHWWYAGLRSALDLFWKRHVAGSFGAEVRVLDAGCGTGANLVWLCSKARPFGVDLSGKAVQLARKRSQTATAVASVLKLPFPDEAFDVVLSCDVLCHEAIREPSAALHEMARVLKRGGRLLLNVPAYQWLRSSHDVQVENARRFSRASVEGLLTGSGFDLLGGSYWNTILFPAIAVARLWRKVFPRRVSDLKVPAADHWGGVFGGVLAVERALMRCVGLPFGLSYLAVGKKA